MAFNTISLVRIPVLLSNWQKGRRRWRGPWMMVDAQSNSHWETRMNRKLKNSTLIICLLMCVGVYRAALCGGGNELLSFVHKLNGIWYLVYSRHLVMERLLCWRGYSVMASAIRNIFRDSTRNRPTKVDERLQDTLTKALLYFPLHSPIPHPLMNLPCPSKNIV